MNPRPPESDILWLDGMPDEAVAVPGANEPHQALGSDPFDALPDPEPFEERLAELAVTTPQIAPVPDPEPRRVPTEQAKRSQPSPPRLRRRTWTQTPRVSEVELPDRPGLMERFLDGDVRKRLAALTHLLEGEAPYDRYGFSPLTAQNAFPFFYALYRFYFRVKSFGASQIPEDGPAVLAANHAGLLPFDGAMTILDVLLQTDPPRLPRTVLDRWAGELPWVNVFYARVGQVVGTRENVTDLLEDGQVVLVFPEGMDGIRKTVTQRYRLQRFRVGFVEHALRARAPIVPVAVIGSDDQTPILYDLKGIAKRLGLPVLPITPTFPWLGPLGLLPYPVRYRIVYGEPLRFYERFGPEGAEDPRLVRYLANQVRREIQVLIDRSRG